MSKFIVDELPYYGDDCILFESGMCHPDEYDCPRNWSKYKVSSKENPHECLWLKESEQILSCLCPTCQGKVFEEV